MWGPRIDSYGEAARLRMDYVGTLHVIAETRERPLNMLF